MPKNDKNPKSPDRGRERDYDISGRRRFLTFVGREERNKEFVVFCKIDGEWLHSKWPYILEDTFAEFQMNISSFLVIKDRKELWTDANIDKNVQQWFDDNHRKLIGAHLFTTRFGTIQMVYMSVQMRAGLPIIATSEPFNINAIYPVIRNEEDPGLQHLIIGLFFGSCDKSKYRSIGNRLHQKMDYSWHTIDNCWELNEKLFDDKFVRQWHNFEGRHHFALFVDSCTKLTVTDNCLPEGQKTRSLIQQGGVVIVEGQLRIRIKELDSSYSFEECFNNGVFVPRNKEMKAADYQNPVLFLHATESKFDSLCWDLVVTQTKEDNRSKALFILMLPFACRFSLVNWDSGMEEIWARHSYQRLYESNITVKEGTERPNVTEFRLPRQAILNKILGLEPQRLIKCEHKVKLPPLLVKGLDSVPPMTPIHSFRRIKSIKPDVIMDSKDNWGYTIPPAYPPIEYKINNIWHYLYLPNNKEKVFEEDLYRHAVTLEIDGRAEPCLRYGDRVYRLKNRVITMDEFETVKHVRQLEDKPTAERYSIIDGVSTRLGADGWIYKSKGTPVCTYETLYYYRFK